MSVCLVLFSYDGFDVPDTMNVHGIYDMKAYMLVFDNKEQYQKHLVRESGDTLRGPFFRKEAKETFEMGTEESLHLSMATFSIDIERWEISSDTFVQSTTVLRTPRYYGHLISLVMQNDELPFKFSEDMVKMTPATMDHLLRHKIK